jgi:hypothetical protein
MSNEQYDEEAGRKKEDTPLPKIVMIVGMK